MDARRGARRRGARRGAPPVRWRRVAGSFIRGGLRFTPLRLLDSAGGLLLGGAIGLAIVWVGASVALLTPGRTAFRQRGRALGDRQAARLGAAAPHAAQPARAHRPVPLDRRPEGAPLPPSKGVLRDPVDPGRDTRVVKVLGTACGVGVEGSGWIGGRDLVVTAAHVVAGERDTTVRIPATPPLRPRRRRARLAQRRRGVARLRSRPRAAAARRPASGAAVAILGYPLDGGLTATPGRMGRTATVLTQDALGHGPVARTITAVAGGSCTATPAARRSTRAGRSSRRSSPRVGSASGYGVPPSIIARRPRKALNARLHRLLRALAGSGNSSTTSSGRRNGATT